MSDFNVLYRSLHRDQKIIKKVKNDSSSSESKGSAESEAPLSSILAWFAKVSK